MIAVVVLLVRWMSLISSRVSFLYVHLKDTDLNDVSIFEPRQLENHDINRPITIRKTERRLICMRICIVSQPRGRWGARVPNDSRKRNLEMDIAHTTGQYIC